MSETFTPKPGNLPDYGLAADWSGRTIPGPDTIAIISGATASVDPGATLTARIVLENHAALSGNGGGFSLGDGSVLSVAGAAALYADGAIVERGTLAVEANSTLAVIVDAGATESYGLKIPSLENTGQVTIFGAATLAVEGTELSNTGAIVVAGGLLDISGGAVDGGQGTQPIGGDIILENGGGAQFSDSLANQRIIFDGAGTLTLSDVNDIHGVTLRGFSTLDSIYVPNLIAGTAALKHLTFSDLPAHTAPEVLATATGAEILLEAVPPCFARGTCLLTPNGYRAVETLQPGDPVVTASGDIRPIRWIGSRVLDIAAHRRPDAVRPIRLEPGALAPDIPARPLRLSPDHAVFLEGVLVPAKLLVNGATILRERACLAVTYYHVELDRHDILLAENLPLESYLDTGNRAMFGQTKGTPRRHPVFGRGTQWDAAAYAPLCLGGPALRRIRATLRARTEAQGFAVRTLTDISLWSDTRRLSPAAGPADRWRFTHDGSPGPILIRSPSFSPAEFLAGAEGEPDAGDERQLGLALSAIQLNQRRRRPRRLAISGFHEKAAGDPADWTDGEATINLPPGIMTIGLTIAALPLGWTRVPVEN